jgi:RNA polymerase sigma-70 factor (ECF subfamily)
MCQNDIITWITHASQKQTVSLADTITQELVLPLQEKFSSRITDKLLIEAAQIDAKLFSELYLKYKTEIKKYFLYHVNNLEEAEDLTQETFVRAFRFLPHFTVSNASYLTYLKRIAHNLVVNYYRDKKTTIPLENICEYPTDDRLFLDHLNTKELTEQLLASLTPFEQELLTERYLEGHPIRAIAIHLGKTENAIKLTLSRLRKKIKQF